MEDDVKFILSIDGGGFRGIIPAVILSEIEKRVTEQISKEICEDVDIKCADLFDIISGTSTGSILTLGLSVPNENNRPKYSAEFLEKFYEDNGHNVFSNYSTLMLKHFFEKESEELMAGIKKTNELMEKTSILGRIPSFGKKNNHEQIGVKIEELTKDKIGDLTKSTKSTIEDLNTNKTGDITNSKIECVSVHETGIVTTNETKDAKKHRHNKLLTSIMDYLEFHSPFKPKYDGKKFEELLQQHFVNAKLKNTVNNVKIVAPSYDISNGEGVIFTNFENKYDELLMKDVVQASAAAPTYFPAKKIRDRFFIDGGVFLNNPSAVTYLKAKKQFPNSKFVVISLGTGYYNEPLQKYAHSGVLQWGLPLISLLFAVDLDNNDMAMSMMAELDNTKYYRLQQVVEKNTAMDIVTDKEIATLVKMANEIMDKPENNFDEIINILVNKCRKKKIFPPKVKDNISS
ncbi:acyl transferase/acyl hydrolase/lysophospholipase [Gigaspora rosea]|uniref:Acyl transferase/acyl hydrolase/lysophospholipase n=1 Tax=Gigaspora rosea TaxID=44941 RepID=A0A397WA85_9GLOM|nr:acyl transferase/acyl hydrolase/lysophospholipase [Gigaspora rosea]CAG8732057.1 25037_t:CDS:1 [Gigaspora rosea]